jgi:NADP-dependent 3-hydroxy acid dehydrogenase YdfG
LLIRHAQGREVVQYLIEHPDASSFTLQLGARSLAKLEDLALVLGIKDKVELLHVDVANEEQVNNAVKGAASCISFSSFLG